MAAPYRNDHDALMTRLTGLLDELAAIRSRTAALRDLGRSEQDVEREIAAIRREVARVAPTRLPLLDRVSIATPCPADWDSMTGDERSRFCALCQKNVYNIASMTAEEAEAFLRGAGGEACLRLYRRADGTVLTSDCPVGVRRRRRRRAVASVVSAGLVAAGALVAFERSRPVMGALPSLPMTTGVMVLEPPPTATTTPSTEPSSAKVAAPIPVPAGGMRRVRHEDQLEAELAHVRGLLDQRAKTRDPAQRRDLEQQIRAASQKVVDLSPRSQ
jgi:hypothetical protein